MSLKSGHSRTSSILKKSKTLNEKLQSSIATKYRVKFVLPHSQNIRNILKDYLLNGTSKEYQKLLCAVRDCEFSDEDLSVLLKEATECISLLNNDLRLFTDVLLSLRWADREEKLVNEYQSFLVNLLAAHNYHAKIVLEHLVSIFIPSPSEELWEDGIPTDIDCTKCVNVHLVLNTIFKIIPMCKDLFLKTLISNYPYYKKGAHINEYYLHNLLWVLDYQPSLKSDILHLVFSRLILMDVNASREDVQKAYSDTDDMEEEMFPFDDTKSCASFKSTSSVGANVVVETLDVCLNRMLHFILTECHNSSTQELDWDKTKDTYRDLLVIFDEVILPTYNCHHVQFCWFVLCGFKTTLAEAFLDHLWKKVIDPNVAAVLRQTSVEYIGSLLARASYINLKMLKLMIRQLADWIHAYINTQDGLECINSDLRVHQVFYSTCQALFYTTTFRHKEMVGTKKDIAFLQSLNFTKIVTSRLNPLRFCQPAVVQNFAAFTRNYQLAYCYSVIEHNSRNGLPTIYRSEKGSVIQTSAVLEANYPFDPCLLKRCSEKVRPFYREYEEFDLAAANGEATEQRDTEMTETDDFLDQDFDKASKFSYGTSPGFKFNI